jgi:hypothetical protein
MSSPSGRSAVNGRAAASWNGVAMATTVLALAAGCALFPDKKEGPQPPTPPTTIKGPDPLPVKIVPEDVVIAVWSEPPQLPARGGQAQILVRLQKKGGAPFEGVEVRLRTSAGSLFSRGKILISDATGRTRDRLTTRETANVTLNAGGTVYRFRVPVGEPPTD